MSIGAGRRNRRHADKWSRHCRLDRRFYGKGIVLVEVEGRVELPLAINSLRRASCSKNRFAWACVVGPALDFRSWRIAVQGYLANAAENFDMLFECSFIPIART
jgi:hypothetical protein